MEDLRKKEATATAAAAAAATTTKEKSHTLSEELVGSVDEFSGHVATFFLYIYILCYIKKRGNKRR